ncbi:TfoX/Sxy family protein [Nocardia rhamnosiphila]|uniref:TfoX/Sxy family protein n=1 Tax=Nocardia rhamnosiphila TaxID=426716 RepID=A0ABV2X218_9NOCA|nr:TfoX/Sxy family protein [Nocardia rhamnosiphila]
MAYDEELAERVRAVVEAGADVSERRMFGGLAFLIGGHMGVAVSREGGLMVRMEPAAAAALVDDVSVTPMVMQGRELDGWLRVTAAAIRDDRDLTTWVERGVRFAGALPPKTPKPPAPRRKNARLR